MDDNLTVGSVILGSVVAVTLLIGYGCDRTSRLAEEMVKAGLQQCVVTQNGHTYSDVWQRECQ